MAETVRHALPLLSAGQAQKEITHNEALWVLDRKLHLAVESRALAAPPQIPLAGQAYIVAENATGQWIGRDGCIASYDGFGWTFSTPVKGCLAWISDEAVFAVYDAAWSNGGWPATGLRIAGRDVLMAEPTAIAAPLGGDVIDAQCRVALAQLVAALRDQGIVF